MTPSSSRQPAQGIQMQTLGGANGAPVASTTNQNRRRMRFSRLDGQRSSRQGRISRLEHLKSKCKPRTVRVGQEKDLPAKKGPGSLTNYSIRVQIICQVLIIGVTVALWVISAKNTGLVTVRDTGSASYDASGYHGSPIVSQALLWTSVPAWILAAYALFWTVMMEDLTSAYITLELMKDRQVPFFGQANTERARKMTSWMTKTAQKLKLALLVAWLRQHLQSLRDRSSKYTKEHAVRPIAWPLKPVRYIERSLAKRLERRPTQQQTQMTTVGRSLFMDYGHLPLRDTWRAWHNGQVLLGLCMIMGAPLWFAGGLAAVVLSPATAPYNTTAVLSNQIFFDEALGQEFGHGVLNSSIMPAFDIVSAILLEAAPAYPWTTGAHSFLPLQAPPSAQPGNYTVMTNAYGSTLDCMPYSIDQLVSGGGVSTDTASENETQITFVFNDEGGCLDFTLLYVEPTVPIFSRTWTSTACGYSAGRGRVGLMIGEYSDTAKLNLGNFTFLSCQPAWWTSNATVTLSYTNENNATILAATTQPSQEVWPYFWNFWLGDLARYSTSDPTFTSNLDVFGSLVYQLAKERNSNAPFERANIINCTQTVYSALYAAFVTTAAYYPHDQRTGVQAIFTSPRLRLFVFDRAAAALIGIMAGVLLVTLALGWHLHRNAHLLKKHHDEILGHALLFRGSNIEDYLKVVEDECREEWRARNAARTEQELDNLIGQTDLVEFAQDNERLKNVQCRLETTTDKLTFDLVQPNSSASASTFVGQNGPVTGNGNPVNATATRPQQLVTAATLP